MRYSFQTTTLGLVLIATDDVGICAVLFSDSRESLVAELTERFSETAVQDDSELRSVMDDFLLRLEDPRAAFDHPLNLRGTDFQRKVWSALIQIPSGTTFSYSELADQIGMPKAARAVASACAANHIAVLVPCHRVVRQDGGLSGYRWGMERKRRLLEAERALIQGTLMPARASAA